MSPPLSPHEAMESVSRKPMLLRSSTVSSTVYLVHQPGCQHLTIVPGPVVHQMSKRPPDTSMHSSITSIDLYQSCTLGVLSEAQEDCLIIPNVPLIWCSKKVAAVEGLTYFFLDLG